MQGEQLLLLPQQRAVHLPHVAPNPDVDVPARLLRSWRDACRVLGFARRVLGGVCVWCCVCLRAHMPAHLPVNILHPRHRPPQARKQQRKVPCGTILEQSFGFECGRLVRALTGERHRRPSAAQLAIRSPPWGCASTRMYAHAHTHAHARTRTHTPTPTHTPTHLNSRARTREATTRTTAVNLEGVSQGLRRTKIHAHPDRHQHAGPAAAQHERLYLPLLHWSSSAAGGDG